MKIVFCGPPHSGKSVFIANLIDKLPTNAYTIIRACPDGEGTWSNNKKQIETANVRKKGKFTKSFIDDSCKAIDNQTNQIVLVDVGGVMSKENEQIFKHCDSFVVLSSDETKKKEWLEFGKKLGLECVGCIDSSLEGEEEIYSKIPYIQGRIVGLERGEVLEESSIIKTLVSNIVRESKYTEKTQNEDENFTGVMIDDTELGFELGYGKEILTDDGIAIKKVRWDEKAIPQIYQNLQEKTNGQEVRINGVRANFILSAICRVAKQQGAKDISAYDIRLKQYIPIKDLPKKNRVKQTNGLSYNIISNKENIFMDIDITKEQYSLEDYQQCVLPKIREDKNLYLSGRLPLWLLASISSSYNSSKLYTFQPGKGFTCIAAENYTELGTIVDGVNGININQYFQDKRDSNTKKLPTTIEKQGIFSKIGNWIARFKERKDNNTKYLDDTIIANAIEKMEINSASKNKFQEEIQEESKPVTKNPIEDIPKQGISVEGDR